MNSASVEMFGVPLNLRSGEIVKEAIKELFREEPEILQDALQGMLSEISERIDLTQVEQVKDRSRIADIELLLGLDDEVQNPEDPYYMEKKERLDELKQRSSFLQSCQISNEKEDGGLYKELQRRGFMKTRDVMNYMGFKHYQQARRVMEKLSEDYKDVILDPNDQGKGHRIRVLQYK